MENEFIETIEPSNERKPISPHWKTAIGILLVLGVLILIPRLIQQLFIASGLPGTEATATPEHLSTTKMALEKEIGQLDRKLAAKIPKIHYMVINTSANEFSVFKGNELIRKEKCSTGSYIRLKKGDKQEWMFKTPKGEFKVRSKTTFPVWKKPDWAFVEAGLPIPSANDPSRFEYGVLGDYALNLGQGYLIHGTLYQRFIGMPVTHGCVRLNDDNLEFVYRNLTVGSKVFIY